MVANDIFLTNMGDRISQRRKELHLTQEQLADKMGLSLQSISCIELGKKAIWPENLAKLCICLDVTADYILYGKRNEKLMSDTIVKLSSLSPDAYCAIQNLINLLSEWEAFSSLLLLRFRWKTQKLAGSKDLPVFLCKEHYAFASGCLF